MSGQTTRLVDECIQNLFREGVVVCKDHYDLRDAHEELQRRVVRRLESEHKFLDFNYSKSTHIVEIVKKLDTGFAFKYRVGNITG